MPVSRVRYRPLLNLGSSGIRFSILIIANSTAIDAYVGSRDPTCEPGSQDIILIASSFTSPSQHTTHVRSTDTVVPLNLDGARSRVLGWHGASNAAPTSQISGA